MTKVIRLAVFGIGMLAAAAACGGGGGETIDADLDIDMAPPPGCTAAASYGTPALADQDATHDDVDRVYLLSGGLNADTDLLRIQLNDGVGVFDAGAGGVRTGFFPIAGAEAQYATCGLCLLIFADTSATSLPNLDSPYNNYLAVAGDVQIDSVSPNLTGTLTDVQLQHVTIDRDLDFQSTVVGDCTATIDSLAFDVPVTEI
jgi:hypothetical protein